MMQDAREEAAPLFAILTHAEWCRMRGKKQLCCLGERTTQRTVGWNPNTS